MKSIMSLRKLERQLFAAWCSWLCYPARSASEEVRNQLRFVEVLRMVDQALESTRGPFFLAEFSSADVIFAPSVERMLASLFYYKGFNMKEASPTLARWFAAMERREAYRGTQSDAHTHCHDLPPQMGGCFENGTQLQQRCKAMVDEGPWDKLPDCSHVEPKDALQEALARTMKHREGLVAANCVQDKAKVDEALRAALTTLMTGKVCAVADADAAIALHYIRDRVNVPRDLSVWAARRFREALTRTAATAGGSIKGPAIPVEHRYDHQPAKFGSIGA